MIGSSRPVKMVGGNLNRNCLYSNVILDKTVDVSVFLVKTPKRHYLRTKYRNFDGGMVYFLMERECRRSGQMVVTD